MKKRVESESKFMRIGYSTTGETDECQRLKEEGRCEWIEVNRETPHTLGQFLAFLNRHRTKEIVVVNLESINLSISHYETIEEAVRSCECELHFLEKELASDGVYLHVLAGLAKRDVAMMSRRTHEGLEKAKANGKIGGRPSLNPALIERIQVLHQVHRKTIREISTECGVSLGTVHKYITRLETSENNE